MGLVGLTPPASSSVQFTNGANLFEVVAMVVLGILAAVLDELGCDLFIGTVFKKKHGTDIVCFH